MKDWQDRTTEKLNPFRVWDLGFGIREVRDLREGGRQVGSFRYNNTYLPSSYIRSDWVRNFEIRFYWFRISFAELRLKFLFGMHTAKFSTV